jgi:glutamyl-tRNA synthetase
LAKPRPEALEDAMIVGRLAPSPTGAQHIGNARTYLIAWLAARSAGDKVLLRIEDIDSPRVKPAASREALEDLRWLGLDWDGEPIVQSTRMDWYSEALSCLRERELVYPCLCTRSDIERAASAPHAEHEGSVYPGTCAYRRANDLSDLDAASVAWRFRLPEQIAAFDDAYRGLTAIDLHECGGDFVVWKAAGTPAYQLAVVVDDAATGVTQVIRGDDLLPSTPRQLLLYEALRLTPPRFAHVPLVVGPDGRRLAKRHGDTRLSALRRAGIGPEKLLGFLAWSCGWVSRIEPVSLKDLLVVFRLGLIPPKPLIVDEAMLSRLLE